MDILIRASKFLWVKLDLRGALIKFIYEKLLSTEAVEAGQFPKEPAKILYSRNDIVEKNCSYGIKQQSLT
jgi:hypothetical protein